MEDSGKQTSLVISSLKSCFSICEIVIAGGDKLSSPLS